MTVKSGLENFNLKSFSFAANWQDQSNLSGTLLIALGSSNSEGAGRFYLFILNRPLYTIIFKLENVNFKTRDFS